ncbi:uncharacterized protein LOC121401616 isoform X1 [Xenopus laevis]|uniref:Uncharacterized protein LOC121401616 isoform X1 n=1 Tax=Xenopus laevis TaxID=8355 RepID=A0A8J1MNR2_XENLA|nr:uncharacterized protein LOC121401616 isoform X1 [Xenopus laevis]
MRQENRETGNKKLIYCHKMNRGKCQGHADDNIYQNVGDCKKEPTENPGKKKKEIHQDPRQESKYLKATERLRAQRTLLIAMMILHILTLILLILFSSFLVTYSSDIFGQLNKTGKEKTDPAPLIIAINVTFGEEKTDPAPLIIAINVTFDNSNSVCSDVTLALVCVLDPLQQFPPKGSLKTYLSKEDSMMHQEVRKLQRIVTNPFQQLYTSFIPIPCEQVPLML